jgi:predicted DNA-binding protein (UPF0251 family)
VKETLEKSLQKENFESRLRSIWKRFFQVEEKLTRRQRKALALVYTEIPPLTYEQAAQKMKISKDSVQDRITGAVAKIKKALPELDHLHVEKTYFKSKSKKLLYNGLFSKDEEKKIHPLYAIDPVTNLKAEISIWKNPHIKNSKTFPNRDIVRSWAIYATPVPDLMFTDFYLGLLPDGHLRRLTGNSTFRG